MPVIQSPPIVEKMKKAKSAPGKNSSADEKKKKIQPDPEGAEKNKADSDDRKGETDPAGKVPLKKKEVSGK